MNKFNPDKLKVELREGVTATGPIIPRKYTLTHSDLTSELFLTIGRNFAADKLNKMRDEVLTEWSEQEDRYLFFAYVYVDGENETGTEAIRNIVFRKELGLALSAIRYGDCTFFEEHAELSKAPILVFFLSANPEFNKVEDWGTFPDYCIYKQTNSNADR